MHFSIHKKKLETGFFKFEYLTLPHNILTSNLALPTLLASNLATQALFYEIELLLNCGFHTSANRQYI